MTPIFWSCACTLCASAVAVAYSPVSTIVCSVIPPFGKPAAFMNAFAFVRFGVGHGRAEGLERYEGLVIGPVTRPSARAAVSSTCLRSIAHWIASRTYSLSSGACLSSSISVW